MTNIINERPHRDNAIRLRNPSFRASAHTGVGIRFLLRRGGQIATPVTRSLVRNDADLVTSPHRGLSFIMCKGIGIEPIGMQPATARAQPLGNSGLDTCCIGWGFICQNNTANNHIHYSNTQ